MISKEVEATQKTVPEQLSFSSLPDEMVENILARVSRWDYPSLSLVSKRFHSLLSCTQIYKTRSQIGAQEPCFYVCLQLPNQQYPSWFTLWSKPKQTRTKRRGKIRFKQNPNGNEVVPLLFSSSYPHPPDLPAGTVEVGLDVYMIGGHSYKEPSSSVRILDCRSHTLRGSPKMTVPRENASAIFLDEKIYVMGGCEIDDYPDNWIEVFDIKTQLWTALPGPGDDDEELRDQLREYCCLVYASEGKIYVSAAEKAYTYETRNGTWIVINEQSNFLSVRMRCWMNDIVLYGYTYTGYLMWSDSEGREWREIKGLEKLLKHPTRGLRVGSALYFDEYRGKLLVMWDPSGIRRKNKIWYAMISLESRCNGREVWGNIECVDVLTFPIESYEEFFCLRFLV